MARVDTHQYQLIKNFIASGTTEKQAEIFIDAATIIVKEEIDYLKKDYSNLATKDDLFEIKTELKNDISNLEHGILEIKSINTNIKWIMAIILLIAGILLKNTFIH